MKQRFKKLSEANVQALASSFVKFFPKSLPDNLTLGSVKTEEKYFIPLTVEGLSQNFQAGVQAEIIVRPEISEGELTMSGVEVLIEPADKVASLTVCQKKRRKCLCKVCTSSTTHLPNYSKTKWHRTC